jgi:hypothetical protein
MLSTSLYTLVMLVSTDRVSQLRPLRSTVTWTGRLMHEIGIGDINESCLQTYLSEAFV